MRSIAGADTGDPRLVELVGELSLRSERFRMLWARQDVKHQATGTSLFNHPEVGPLALNYERLLISGSDMQALVTYHAQPGSESEERLRLLDSITTTDASVRPRPPCAATTGPSAYANPGSLANAMAAEAGTCGAWGADGSYVLSWPRCPRMPSSRRPR